MIRLVLTLLAFLLMLLLLLVFIYIAARLGTLGAARSWWDFRKQQEKEEGKHE